MTKQHEIHYSISRIGRAIAASVLCLTVVACGEINHLRDAQASFSDSAQLENELALSARTFDSDASKNAALTASVAVGYLSALDSIDKLSEKDKQKLVDDKLWGNVLVMKALANWKLGRYADAINDSDAASKLQDQLGTRDRIVAEVLPSLVENDEQLERMNSFMGKLTVDQSDQFKKAFADVMIHLAAARDGLAEENAMRYYLTLSHLAVFNNYSKACADSATLSRDCREDQFCPAYESYKILEKTIGLTGIAPTDQQDFLRNWRTIAGFGTRSDRELNAECGVT